MKFTIKPLIEINNNALIVHISQALLSLRLAETAQTMETARPVLEIQDESLLLLALLLSIAVSSPDMKVDTYEILKTSALSLSELSYST